MSDTVAVSGPPKRGRKKKAVDAEPPPQLQAPTDQTVAEAPIIIHLRAHTDAAHTSVPAEPEAFNNDEELGSTVTPAVNPLDYQALVSDVGAGGGKLTTDVVNEVLSRINARDNYADTAACFWCCHPFSTSNFPMLCSYNVQEDKYEGHGRYCSPQCVVAALFDSRLPDQDIWLRYALLNAAYGGRNGVQAPIQPAPSRLVLRMFDGPLSIEQFRQMSCQQATFDIAVSNRAIRMNMPLLEVKANDRTEHTSRMLNDSHAEESARNLRIKRSKPVNDVSKTLVGKLNLKAE